MENKTQPPSFKFFTAFLRLGLTAFGVPVMVACIQPGGQFEVDILWVVLAGAGVSALIL